MFVFYSYMYIKWKNTQCQFNDVKTLLPILSQSTYIQSVQVPPGYSRKAFNSQTCRVPVSRLQSADFLTMIV